MKLAVVVQRYGPDINGGAEQHARYIAEHLASQVQVEVNTTCAHRDYISWKNEFPPGKDSVHGITVHRFPVARERDPLEFAKWSQKDFTEKHSLADELAWLEAEGPTSPALVNYIRAHKADYDFFIFFSLRYHHSFHGARAVASKAILVPTAERDGALGLGLYPPLFRGVRAFMYNSHEERALIHGVAANQSVPTARSFYERAIQINATNPYAYLALARHEVEAERWMRALEALDQAELLFGSEPTPGVEAHIAGLRGAARLGKGYGGDAEILLDRATRAAPEVWADGHLSAEELR